MDARRAAELAARNSYGRLVAYLAVHTKDVAAAEDALGEAFLTALNTWPIHSVPSNPEAWLLTTARRRLIDRARRCQTHAKVLNLLNFEGFSQPGETSKQQHIFPDERLKLLFICAHPAIDEKIHTPLMLQTVLGLNATQIASAFLVAPTTMGQRLVRAKAKIRDAGIPFEIPDRKELPTRSQAVLQGIYAAYTSGWSDTTDTESGHKNLTEEAIVLARLCVQFMPDQPEAKGLLALMLFCESRQAARRTVKGQYVPLSAQNTQLWSQPLIHEAEQILQQAATYETLGRFQLEAAIQSIHAQRKVTGQTNWAVLSQLYEGLIQLSPTVGAQLGLACAISQVQGPQVGLTLLESIPFKTINNHQPYWATKAYLLQQLGQRSLAKQAYSQAIGLTEDAATRDFLIQQSSEIS